MNMTPEEALIVRVNLYPENQAYDASVASFTTAPEGERRTRESSEPIFGAHLKEAAAIVRDWWERK